MLTFEWAALVGSTVILCGAIVLVGILGSTPKDSFEHLLFFLSPGVGIVLEGLVEFLYWRANNALNHGCTP